MTINALSFRLAASTVLMAVDSVRARLEPVHSNDPANPNASFSKHVATAAFDFTVTNPEAFDFLKPGVVYDLVMVPRDGDYTLTLVSGTPEEPVDTAQSDAAAAAAPLAPVETIVETPADPPAAGAEAAPAGDAQPSETAPAADEQPADPIV